MRIRPHEVIEYNETLAGRCVGGALSLFIAFTMLSMVQVGTSLQVKELGYIHNDIYEAHV
jgi:hypothetical protein